MKMNNAIASVLMTPTIFFTNGYLSMNISRGGSGLFMQRKTSELKADEVVEVLFQKNLIVKCDVIQNARHSKHTNLSPSYYKQNPSYFDSSDFHKEELRVRIDCCLEIIPNLLDIHDCENKG
jgi:hypothetical protein